MNELVLARAGRRAALLALALLAPALAVARPLVPRSDEEHAHAVSRLIELGRADNRVQDHLDYLTNRIGARLTSSTNLTRACQWATAQFRSWGLDARMEKWGDFPVGFDRRGQTGGMVAPERIDYVFRTPSWTPGTPGPVRGRAVLAPTTLEELDALGERLRGAWVVHGSGRARRSLRQEIEEAFRGAGIAGEIRKGGERIVVFGDHRIEWEDLPDLVSVRLRTDQFEDLVERLEAGQEVELELDIDNRFIPGPVPLYNVVADIKGSEWPDEYVIVGGHIDSWDGATGTNDNGTGVATTLEAARLLVAAGARPKRTIRFMLWSGEEQGLYGSKRYVEAHPDLMPKISAALVHDMGTNYLDGISAPPKVAADLREVFAPVAELDPDMPFEVKENEGFSRMSGSSDHASFLAEGVPGLFWEQDAGRSHYRDFWHTHLDTFDSAIPEYQRHSAIVVAVGALGIADLDHLLERDGLFREGGPSRASSRRRMGVYLDGTEVTEVIEGRMADEAGWQSGDVILRIDDVPVTNLREVIGELQKGGPVKKVVLRRGETEFESVLDYTGSPSEEARDEARKQRAQRAEGNGAEGAGTVETERTTEP